MAEVPKSLENKEEPKRGLVISWTLALPGSGRSVGVSMSGFVASNMGTGGLAATSGRSILELRRRSDVGLGDGGVRSGRGGSIH